MNKNTPTPENLTLDQQVILLLLQLSIEASAVSSLIREVVSLDAKQGGAAPHAEGDGHEFEK